MTSSSDVTRTSDAQPGQRWGTATTVKTGVVVPFTGRRTGSGAVVGTGSGAEVPSGEAFTVDCAECAHRLTDVCGDCVVSFIVGREADDAVVIDQFDDLHRFAIRDGFSPNARLVDRGVTPWEYMALWWRMTHPDRPIFTGVLIDWDETFMPVAS